MLMAAIQNGHHFWIVIVAVIFAAISAYYYFRVIQAIYFKEAAKTIILPHSINTPFKIMLIVIVALILIIGIYPELIIGWMYR
jgi:NADH-quinone oxidoreductase subunit N